MKYTICEIHTTVHGLLIQTICCFLSTFSGWAEEKNLLRIPEMQCSIPHEVTFYCFFSTKFKGWCALCDPIAYCMDSSTKAREVPPSRSPKNSLKWKVFADIGVFSPEKEGARIRVPHSAVARDRRRDAVVYYL